MTAVSLLKCFNNYYLIASWRSRFSLTDILTQAPVSRS